MPLTHQDLALIRRKASEVDADGFPVFQRDNQNALIVRMLDHIDAQEKAVVKFDHLHREACQQIATTQAHLHAAIDAKEKAEAVEKDTRAQLTDAHGINTALVNRCEQAESLHAEVHADNQRLAQAQSECIKERVHAQAKAAELQAEVTRLSGKTGFCADCVKLAGERDALKAIVDAYDAADRTQKAMQAYPLTDGSVAVKGGAN